MTDNTENHKKYWDGGVNKAIRYYFYIMRGLDIFNQFKYLVAAIFALYWMLKLANPVILVVMFAVCIPVLFVIGYYSVHYIGKVMEWLNVEFSSHWSRYSFDLQERQVKAIESVEKNVEMIAKPCADSAAKDRQKQIDQMKYGGGRVWHSPCLKEDRRYKTGYRVISEGFFEDNALAAKKDKKTNV